MEQAFARAVARGVVVVGIARNDGGPEVSYPAKFPGVVAVGATDPEDRLASFSNWGPEVEVAAPGSWVASLLPGGRTAVQRGHLLCRAPGGRHPGPGSLGLSPPLQFPGPSGSQGDVPGSGS